ncbi:MAG: hypothetical protein AB7O97_07530 [Planctomycetota bacterium]
MRRPMLVSFVLPVAVLAAFAACRGIPRAPKDAPRVEVEVAVVVEDGFSAALADADAALTAALSSALIEEADIGLRFYPVAAADYADGQRRPDYRLQVTLRGLEVDVTSGSDEQASAAERVTAALGVALQRQRADAPALLVASASQSANRREQPARTDGPVEASYRVAGSAQPVSVSQDAIVTAVRAAFRRAAADMVRAIDREFAPARS